METPLADAHSMAAHTRTRTHALSTHTRLGENAFLRLFGEQTLVRLILGVKSESGVPAALVWNLMKAVIAASYTAAKLGSLPP